MSAPGADTLRTLHVRVEGRVQGVGFRRFVERSANALGLAGWARNLTDGSVEVLAVGAAADLERLRERLATGPAYAAVARLLDQQPSVTAPGASPFRLLPDASPGGPVPPADPLG